MNELLYALISQDPAAAPPGGCAQAGSPLVMMMVIFAIFYFVMIRPQQKQMREHQQKLSRLKKGDAIIMNGGLVGTIHAAEEKELTLEVADKVRVRVLRSQVADVHTIAPEPAPEKAK